MDSIAYTPRLPYAQAPSGNAARTSSQQPRRAVNPAGKVATPSLSIFQRALLWIKGWVQGLAKAESIDRALSPFIKAAKADSANAITPEHLGKLASALSDEGNLRSFSLFAETVRKSIKSHDLAGLKRLKTSLDGLKQSGTQLEKTLFDTVDGCIKDAKVNEAKRSLSLALSIFSEWSAKPVDADSEIDISLNGFKHELLTMIDLFEPVADIAVVNDAAHLRKVDFKAASSVITEQALDSWFLAHSHTQKLRVKANIWNMAQDSVLEHDASEANRAMHAFCGLVTKSLWPKDRRHGLP